MIPIRDLDSSIVNNRSFHGTLQDPTDEDQDLTNDQKKKKRAKRFTVRDFSRGGLGRMESFPNTDKMRDDMARELDTITQAREKKVRRFLEREGRMRKSGYSTQNRSSPTSSRPSSTSSSQPPNPSSRPTSATFSHKSQHHQHHSRPSSTSSSRRSILGKPNEEEVGDDSTVSKLPSLSTHLDSQIGLWPEDEQEEEETEVQNENASSSPSISTLNIDEYVKSLRKDIYSPLRPRTSVVRRERRSVEKPWTVQRPRRKRTRRQHN